MREKHILMIMVVTKCVIECPKRHDWMMVLMMSVGLGNVIYLLMCYALNPYDGTLSVPGLTMLI